MVFQTIRNLVSFVMPIIDLQKLSNNNNSAHLYKEEEAKYLVNEKVKRPFDLVNGPILRVSLVNVNNKISIQVSSLSPVPSSSTTTTTILLLNIHHIASDGW